MYTRRHRFIIASHEYFRHTFLGTIGTRSLFPYTLLYGISIISKQRTLLRGIGAVLSFSRRRVFFPDYTIAVGLSGYATPKYRIIPQSSNDTKLAVRNPYNFIQRRRVNPARGLAIHSPRFRSHFIRNKHILFANIYSIVKVVPTHWKTLRRHYSCRIPVGRPFRPSWISLQVCQRDGFNTVT